jgi:hypothetical protein
LKKIALEENQLHEIRVLNRRVLPKDECRQLVCYESLIELYLIKSLLTRAIMTLHVFPEFASAIGRIVFLGRWLRSFFLEFGDVDTVGDGDVVGGPLENFDHLVWFSQTLL